MKKIQSYHIILVLAVIVFFWFTYEIILQNPHIDFYKGSQYGTLLAGIFSFISVVLITFTLKHQSDTAKLTQFEDRFFQLLKIQRENSENICLDDIKGRKVFLELLNEFNECYKIVTLFTQRENLKYSEEDQIDLAYRAFFYGVFGDKSRPVILEIMKHYKFSDQQIDNLINAFDKKRNSNANKFTHTFFEGHQIRLGHYYRHLFQSITYINKQNSPFLNYKRRYEFIKLYRAQLSTQEQILLFLNSLSKLGKRWERAEELVDPNDKLITKYNLLTNIASTIIFDMIDIEKYYPLLTMEGKEKKNEKILLEKKYK